MSKNSGSFRDPSGFIFEKDGVIYRQVNRTYQKNYDQLMTSDLYETLVDSGLLIPHNELDDIPLTDNGYKLIKPAQIPFISYPYEWSFSQLKDAALLTLRLQRKAMDYGMSLKDCSAYNVQFSNGRPIFIDTLSFEVYQEGQPWVAYRQFCQHFLAPLTLMSHTDIRLQQLLRVYIDGIPLDLTSKMLPVFSWLNFAMFSHIHLHAKSQQRFAGRAVSVEKGNVGRTSFLGLIDNLQTAIKKLKWQPTGTEWHDYYTISNYSSGAMAQKKKLVARMFAGITPVPGIVWDLGANTGIFSQIAAEQGVLTISFDIDPAAVEKNYLECRTNKQPHILPLVLDLTNPSPGLGWNNRERESLFERGPAEVVLALALIHHLVIANNVPFEVAAQFFSRVCSRALIIEFIPKSDSQVQKLLQNRVDIFGDYNRQTFEQEFGRFFTIQDRQDIIESDRTLYLMTKQPSASLD